MGLTTSIGLLVACAASAAQAHETSIDTLHLPGYCPSPHLLASSPLLSSTQICTKDTRLTPTDTATHHSPWTRVSSCTPASRPSNTDPSERETWCVYTSGTFSGGRGISVITTASRAAFMAGLPAFTQPQRQQEHDKAELAPPYEFVHVPGKDMGVVATRPIYRGHLLMSVPAAVMIDHGAFAGLTVAEVLRMQAAAVDGLPGPLRGEVSEPVDAS